MLNNIVQFLKGKKTFICSALGLIVVFLSWIGKIDTSSRDVLLGLLGFSGLASLRLAITNK